YAPRVGDVAHERAAREGGAEHRQVLLHGRGRLGAQVVHRHASAGAREGERDLAPQARARPGDERDLPVEVRHGAGCDITGAARACSTDAGWRTPSGAGGRALRRASRAWAGRARVAVPSGPTTSQSAAAPPFWRALKALALDAMVADLRAGSGRPSLLARLGPGAH